MDEEVAAVDATLRRLLEEAGKAVSSLKELGAPGTKSQASELSKSINAAFKQLRGHLRDLEQLAEEQDTAEASLRVERLVKEHKMQYENVKKEQDFAAVAMKKNSERVWRMQRQELLSGGKSRTQLKDDCTAVAASEGITESLRRTRQMMTEQIGLADANTQLIGIRIISVDKNAKLCGLAENSTSVLGKTRDELKSQRKLFTSSRRLLSTMSWYDMLDRIVLYGGVGFFLVVVLYITQKRMLGLTPQFVKSSISGFTSSSVETARSYYYQNFGQSSGVLDDSAKFPPPKSEDLDRAEEIMHIKAVHRDVDDSSDTSEGSTVAEESTESVESRVDPEDDTETNKEADKRKSEDVHAAEKEAESGDVEGDQVKQFPDPDEGISESLAFQIQEPTLETDDPLYQTSDETADLRHESEEESKSEDPHLIIPEKQEAVPADVFRETNAHGSEEDEYLDPDSEELQRTSGHPVRDEL